MTAARRLSRQWCSAPERDHLENVRARVIASGNGWFWRIEGTGGLPVPELRPLPAPDAPRAAPADDREPVAVA
jgi:hypothetical protein